LRAGEGAEGQLDRSGDRVALPCEVLAQLCGTISRNVAVNVLALDCEFGDIEEKLMYRG
jgi:hypothetical protein